jgi:serine/threonine-protein kinase
MHRDLKPGNVFVDKSGEPRVLDFGLARPMEGDGAAVTLMVTTQANAFLGTFAYAAPEQVRGERNLVDTRSDVYSLGVILHELLTQTPAALRAGAAVDAQRVVTGRATERPSELRRGIDRDVDAIVMRCLEDDPANRYQTAGSLQRDIEHYLAGQPVNARRRTEATPGTCS